MSEIDQPQSPELVEDHQGWQEAAAQHLQDTWELRSIEHDYESYDGPLPWSEYIQAAHRDRLVDAGYGDEEADGW